MRPEFCNPLIFLLVVDKYGVGLQAERAVLAHRVGVEVLIIRPMAPPSNRRQLVAEGMEIDIEFQVGAVLGDVLRECA